MHATSHFFQAPTANMYISHYQVQLYSKNIKLK